MSEELDLHLAPRVGSETFQRLASMSLRSTSDAATSAVSFRGVERHFGAVKAVDGVDLDIRPGEFFAMLGPSGSGKTTCLRLIGGFDQPTAGSIEIFGEAGRHVRAAVGVSTLPRNALVELQMVVRI